MEHRQKTSVGRIAAALLGCAAPVAVAFAQASQPTAPATTSPAPASAAAPADLADGFRNPPQSARPRVWWHWMNGNITKDGIAKDLQWMSDVGIGGLQNFDAALQTPQVVDKRLIYMTPEWKDAFRYAAGLAEEKGLEMAVAASPGWSETGGPWVKPADAMKKLVWSETVVEGGRPLRQPLAAPPSVTGPFQDAPRVVTGAAAAEAARPDPVYYADVAVLAFPLPDGGAPAALPRLTGADGQDMAAAGVNDGSLRSAITIPAATAEVPAIVVADFGAARRVRSLTLSLGRAVPLFSAATLVAQLEVEGDGGWRKVADVPVNVAAQTTVSFAAVTARRFRVVFTSTPGGRTGADGTGVPGAVPRPNRNPPSPTITIAELRLTDENRVDRFEAKGAYGIAQDYYALDRADLADTAGVPTAQVVDLTARMRADGTLDWRPPAGRWRIVRFGTSLLGTTNHPAPPEATGLEVDKFDGRAVADYTQTYIDMVRSATGPDLFGAKGLRAILTDSIEVGPSNWTRDMVAQFRTARGYDPTPWPPTLAGTIVGSRAQSDRFLYDYRLTLTELMASQHYGKLAEVAHANGLTVYGEALEVGRPTLGDDLAMRAHADIPMAAMWTYPRASGPRYPLLGDMKGAASVAHVYGGNLAAAESLTAASSPWAFGPRDLKPTLDLELIYGINRPVIHTSVHQPVDDKVPGMSLGPFGQYFNRHETWGGMAKPWVDYIARSSYMLQQGRYFADVAYFHGEDMPITVLYADGVPADVPTRYAFDFVNRDILERQLSNDGGDLLAPSGARYRALYLGGSSRHMTLATLRRIAALVEGGATVVGNAPVGSPSLADDAGAFKALVGRLWSGSGTTQLGKGRVIAGTSIENALGGMGITPDFVAGNAAPGDVLFLHRRLADGDAYFLSSRKAAPQRIEARFRVTGKVPELWHADTGTGERVSYRTEGADTVVPLDLDADEAVFVVFRTPATAASATVASPAWQPLATIDDGWDVAFQPGRGAPARTRMASLASLSASDTPGIRYFSGTSTYTRSFTLPRGTRAGAPLMLDLGEVGDVAEVRINGQVAGIAWKAPYRLDIGKLVRAGTNRVEVRVANLWVNRLVGDAQPGAQKITWTAAPTYLPDAPLRAAGLIGPVTLLGQGAAR